MLRTLHSGSPIPAKAGIGLRALHLAEVMERRPPITFLEVHPENYFGGGAPVDALEEIARHYPLSFHGVGLSLGTQGALDKAHIRALARLAERIRPGLISDHLSWSASGNAHLGDLLPLPYTHETLAVVADHIDEVQDALGRRILVENPSTYLAFMHSTMEETEFLAALVERTGCGLLLDVNNVYVQCHNNGGNAYRYIDAVPSGAVGEIHLAGHMRRMYGDETLLIDTHDGAVCDAVWALYDYTIGKLGATPTLIEWDRELPTLDVLLAEAVKANARMDDDGGRIHATG